MLTFRRHVEGRAAAKIRGNWLSGSEAKICKLDLGTVIRNQDVFWFQIAVVDSHRVAVFDSVQELQEDSLGQNVVSDVVAMLRNVGEQITFWAEFDNDIGAVDGVQDLDELDDVWVGASAVMQGDFSFLESALSCVETDLGECLDGIWDMGEDVDCGIDDTICANAQNTGEFYSASEQMSYSFLWSSSESNWGLQRSVRHVDICEFVEVLLRCIISE